MRTGGLFVKRLLCALLMGMMLSAAAYASETPSGMAAYTLNYWVEKPDMAGDPGDPVENPEAQEAFMLFKQEVRHAKAGALVKLTAAQLDAYLYTPEQHKPFATYFNGDEVAISPEGTTVMNVYYARDQFTYVFDIMNEQAEMTVSGTTFQGASGEKYTITGKYEQRVVFPGVDNGLLPVNANKARGEVYCAGWGLDSRTGIVGMLACAQVVTEDMLPTGDIPHQDLVFELKALWFSTDETSILVSWYEELPQEEGKALNRLTYNGKTYVNYPATDYPMVLPKGGTPSISSTKGLIFRSQMDPNGDKAGEGGRTWQFIYDRERYDITFDTNGADALAAGRGIMYQQNLGQLDPGWNEETLRSEGGQSYRFKGWYTDQGEFVGYRLSDLYMPAHHVHLNAQWEKAN